MLPGSEIPKIMEEKMEGIDPGLVALMKDGNGNDDKTLWLFLLLLLYGKDGIGGNASTSCCPPLTLEQANDLNNATQNQISQRFDAQQNQMNAAQAAITERTLDITRDQAANSFRLEGQLSTASTLNQLGQKDLTASIADCCCQNLLSQKDTQAGLKDVQNTILSTSCETQRAIERCCCETQNSIQMQTQVLSQAICNEGQLTRQLITDNRMQDLQTALSDQKTANSNLRQTVELTQQIRDACCQPCRPCPSINGNGVPA